MLGYHHVKHSSIFQCTQHNRRVLNTVAVIGKANSTGFCHHSHLGKFDPLSIFCDGTHRINMGLSCLSALSMNILDIGLILDGRSCIRHTDDRCKTGCHRRRRAACYRFLLFIARLTKVNVDINQTRCYQFAGGIDNCLRFLLNFANI